MRLLSIDWDAFFPTGEKTDQWALWDWGHSEKWGGDLLGVIWQSRAIGFTHYDLPLPGTSGEETTFWSRFTFSEDAELFLADSHKAAIAPVVAEGITEVWSWDAHHDAGYDQAALLTVMNDQRVSCQDWMLGYTLTNGLKGKDLHVRYPQWRAYALEDEPEPPLKGIDRAVDDGAPVDLVFDRVFIARSGAWTPPWVDEQFQTFVDNAPLEVTEVLDDMELVRPWDYEEMRTQMKAEKELREQLTEKK